MDAKDSLKNIAKAGVCTSLAGATALSGAASAIADDIVKAKELPMVREAENSGAPNSVDEARIMWELAVSHADETANAAVEAEQSARDAESATVEAEARHEQSIVDATEAEKTRDRVFAQLVADAQANVSKNDEKVAAAANELERAENELADAQEAHTQAQASRDSALSRYEQAQIALAQLGDKPSDTIVEDAQQAATDAEAKRSEAYDKLVQAEAAALEAKNNVQDAQDEKDKTAASLASAKVELDNATTALEKANTELAKAASEERIAELADEVEKAKNKKESAELRVITERQTYEDLENRLGSYQTELADAQAEVTRLQAIIDSTDEELMGEIDAANAAAEANKPAYDEKKGIVDEAKEKLDKAEEELAQREADLEEAKRMLREAESQVNDAQDALIRAIEESTTNNKDVTSASLADFFEANGQSGDAYAQELLNAVMEQEDIGKEGDATDWVNTQSALTLLSFLEDLRGREAGNRTPFLVSSIQMSKAALEANRLSATDSGWKFDFGQSMEPNYDEFGNEIPTVSPYIRPEDQLTMRYASGLDIWNKMKADGVYMDETLSGDWESLSPDELRSLAPKFFSEVELYWLLNNATSDYRIGVGVNTVNGNSVIGLAYEKGNESDHSTGMLVDEWSRMYHQWLNTKLQSDDVLEARNELNVAQGYLLNSSAMTGSLQALVDEMQQTVNELKLIHAEADAEFGLVKDAYEDHLTDVKVYLGQIDENIAAREQARIDIVDAKQTVSQKENLVSGVQGALEVQQGAVQRAASDATRTKYEYDALKKTYDDSSETRAKALAEVEKQTEVATEASQKYKDAQSLDEEAGEALEKRKSEQQQADTAHELALSAHATASDEAQDAKDAIETAKQYKKDWYNADAERAEAQETWEQARDEAASALAAYTAALGKQGQAEKAKKDADDALKSAISAYGRASAAETAASMGIMISGPEFADLSGYVTAANQAQEDVVKAKEALDAAIQAEKEANEAAEAANEKWHTAIAIAAQAKVDYDNLLALEAQKPPVLPDTPIEDPNDNGDDVNDDNGGGSDDQRGDDQNGGEPNGDDQNGDEQGDSEQGNDGNQGNSGNDNGSDGPGTDDDDNNSGSDVNDENAGGNAGASGTTNGEEQSSAGSQSRPTAPTTDANDGSTIDIVDDASSATLDGELVFASAGDVRSTTFVVNPDGSGSVVPDANAESPQADDVENNSEVVIADDETPMDSMDFASDSDDGKSAGALGGGLLAAIGAALVGTSVKPKNRRKVYEQGDHAVEGGDGDKE